MEDHSSPPHQGEAERTQIKSKDDLKLNDIEPFEAQETPFEPPIIIWQTEFVTALAVSATLAALMKGAGAICIDNILEEVNYKGARCHQVKESEFDGFDMLMRRAATEIKPIVCETLTLGIDVKLNYAANVYLFPPGRAISGHGRPLLVVPIERDQKSNPRVIFHSIDQHPEPEGDEIAWPSSVPNKCLVYLLSREGCMTVLYNTAEFMSITYLWKYGGLVPENLEQKNVKLETDSAVS